MVVQLVRSEEKNRVNPADFFEYLPSGHAVKRFTIAPSVEHLTAEALYVNLVFAETSYENRAIQKALVENALRLLRENPGSINRLKYKLVELAALLEQERVNA